MKDFLLLLFCCWQCLVWGGVSFCHLVLFLFKSIYREDVFVSSWMILPWGRVPNLEGLDQRRIVFSLWCFWFSLEFIFIFSLFLSEASTGQCNFNLYFCIFCLMLSIFLPHVVMYPSSGSEICPWIFAFKMATGCAHLVTLSAPYGRVTKLTGDNIKERYKMVESSRDVASPFAACRPNVLNSAPQSY